MNFDFVKQLMPMYFGRHYHNVAHVMQCLSEFNKAKQFLRLENMEFVRVALWFHDAVYDTHAKDNEEKSAALAREMLSSQDEDVFMIQEVERLILLTKYHENATDLSGKLMVDCDLSILGQNEFNYGRYETYIRLEYDWMFDADFAKGRIAFLEKMLGRPTIFCSDYFIQTYEQQARRNIRDSIKKLQTVAPQC
jgi:predicted metal-dependent HD superfamily phosphohydrolase